MRAGFIQLFLVVLVWGLWLGFLGLTGAMVILQDHWPVSLTMLFGSFVAGSTSVGGGAVAFPVFTKVLSIPPDVALVFSLAIQSVGMGAASLMIWANRIPVSARVILWSVLGGALGLMASFTFLLPRLPGPDVKYVFSVFGFLVAAALIWDRLDSASNRQAASTPPRPMIFTASLIGGTVSGLIGTGIDFIIFTLMIFVWRFDIKVATATSVVVMAINAMIGFGFILLTTNEFSGEVVEFWQAAVPIVIVGAPIGALACRYLHRNFVFFGLLLLITLDIVSTIYILGWRWPYILAALLVLILAGLYRKTPNASRSHL